jgi:hypothetical protein
MGDTLRSHLTELSAEDPESIFIARRINKLGFRSREILHQHFAQYGVVSRVLVAHSKVKPFRDSRGQLRTRPGGLGLIVMRDAATVRAILSNGEEQMVAGQQIRVQCFERPKEHVVAGHQIRVQDFESPKVGEASCEGSGISNVTTTADSKSQDSKSQDSKSQDSKSDQGFSHMRSSDSDGSSEEARADGGLEDAIADNGPDRRTGCGLSPWSGSRAGTSPQTAAPARAPSTKVREELDY